MNFKEAAADIVHETSSNQAFAAIGAKMQLKYKQIGAHVHRCNRARHTNSTISEDT